MILVIIIIAIVSIFIPIISFQNIIQIKSNMKNEDILKHKYTAEAGLDKTLAEICKQIEEILNNYEEDNNYKIETPKKVHRISDNAFCIVEEINKNIEIIKNNFNILEINDLIFEIISITIKRNEAEEYYKIKSTVKITNDLIDNKYIVNYEVLSYEKI